MNLTIQTPKITLVDETDDSLIFQFSYYKVYGMMCITDHGVHTSHPIDTDRHTYSVVQHDLYGEMIDSYESHSFDSANDAYIDFEYFLNTMPRDECHFIKYLQGCHQDAPHNIKKTGPSKRGLYAHETSTKTHANG